jgi:hypothetical protein
MKRKKNINIRSWLAYFIGLILGAAISITFALSMGVSFLGITLGLSTGLFIGLSLECLIVGDKQLYIVQKALLFFSMILLVISVISAFLWKQF